MNRGADRVTELIEGTRRKRRVLVSPEGVPFDIQISGRVERLAALMLDLFFMFVAVTFLYLLFIFVFFADTSVPVAGTLILFLIFIISNFYFIHFELAWQGRTPGKKICGLRAVNRQGGS